MFLGYTQAINLMDYSAIVIPVTKADKSIDIIDPCFSAENDLDALNWEACR
jgi:amidase